MAIAQVQKKTGTGNTVFTNDPTAGNLLIATFYDSTGTPSVTGFTQAVAVVMSGGTANSGIWYKVAGVGESKTVAIDGGGGALQTAIAEYSGFVGTPTLDQIASAKNTSNSNAASTGTTPTTTDNDELCVAAVAIPGSGTSPSWSNSFTAVQNSARIHQAEKIVSTTGAYETTDTWTGTAVKCFGCIATFKGVATGWPHISKFKGVTSASIAKVNGVAVAGISKVSGVAV